MRTKRRWGEDVGSIDFIQIVVGLLIVGIASVGTFQALQFGNDQLNFQMRYRSATSIARSYIEYWQGRIHTDTPNAREMEGNLRQNVAQTLLDKGDPDDPADDVYCYVRYGKITPKEEVLLGKDKQGRTLISHILINVQVTWWEPDQNPESDPKEIKFTGAMVPAAL